MEFGSNREGFCEEEHQSSTTGKPKLHFSYNSSSSSPSSSSSQYKTTQQLGPSLNNNNRQQMGCWLGSKYDPADEEASINKLDLMEEDVRSASTIISNIEKEHMFDKVVTPSDVGKLNRLVIPKQHAEKFFPLDSSANEKGLLLNFEDRNGKPWRFRYSYWNSSQSYVMTKGWSRFVKDKKLDAGDTVSFQRGVGDMARDRLYIDWRRRPDAPEPSSFPLQHHLSFHRSIPWSPMLMRPPPAPVMARDHLHMSQMNHFLNRNGYYDGGGGGGDGGYGCGSNNVMNPCQMGPVFYLRSQPLQSQPLQAQMGMSLGEWQSHHHHHQYQHQKQQENTMVFDSVPVVQGKAAAKRLRLFGVNMDCPISETSTTTTDDDDECDIVLSSTTLQRAPIMPTIQHHNHHHHHHQLSTSSSSSHSQAAAPLQLRLYNGTPIPPPIDFLNKGKASMS
ncbi:hypothetical protein Ddye_003020 [Dipteronia dyeriana]|uniref:TF-B3 domain-containing protein n=1 Tax=Dipteronia dyeriana TaxID=168575 RepID=A0AAD9XS46_9ROSI|nr:hypothetical protein Ddye_003020 [Dipteronia dyeriana]